MKLSNLEMSEKYIDVQEKDKDVQENDMLLAEVRRQINPLSFCTCTHFIQRIYITPHRTSAEERDPYHGKKLEDLELFPMPLKITFSLKNLSF